MRGPEQDNFFVNFAAFILSTLCVVIGHLVVIVAAIILANVLERHHTHGEKEEAIMLRISFFQVLNNVVVVTVQHTLYPVPCTMYPVPFFQVLNNVVVVTVLVFWARLDPNMVLSLTLIRQVLALTLIWAHP